jgi:peptidoglycan/LPS O-acetylase OafA/YrhL
MNNQQKVFFPNLDAIRFFCFLAVFFYHSFATSITSINTNDNYYFIKKFLFGNGNLGVNFFFVLSGFLITYLLLKEKDLTGTINIKNFYLRRILRIWPLYFFSVLFGFVLFPLFKSYFGQIPNETANPLMYISFLSNFDLLHKGLPDSSVLGVLWSVSIEEQFYLVWPILIAFTPQKRYNYLFFGIIFLSFLFRVINVHNSLALEVHSFSCISDMAIGGIGAYYSFRRGRFFSFIKNSNRIIIAFVYILAVILFLFRKQLFISSYLIPFDRLIISGVFLFIILEQNFSERSIFKFSRLKIPSKLGVYTFGLYCLHMIGILIAQTILTPRGLNNSLTKLIFIEGGLSLILAIIIALISYYGLEKPFLNLKNKFSIITK